MKVAFRVDASLSIGTGHVARCLTLATYLAENAVTCHFIMRELPGDMVDHVRQRGFAVSSLSGHEVPEGDQASGAAVRAAFDWVGDAEQTCAVLDAAGGWDWLVVDHYALDAKWEAACASHVRNLLVIDDLADRPHRCDLILDQNLQTEAGRYDDLVSPDAVTLLGPRFALLRPEFSSMRARTLRGTQDAVGKILVFMGGVDRLNFTQQALEAIENVRDLTSISVDVVVGKGSPNSSAIARWCAHREWVHFHHGSDSMAALMAAADLSIGAGGGASWERCCVGLPAILVAVAPNQRPGSEALAMAGAALFVGEPDGLDPETLESALKLLIENFYARAHMSQSAAAVTDGRGVQRVAAYLLGSTLSLRPAATADCEDLWRWRNAEETRRYSKDSAEINLSAHRRWYELSLASPDRDLLVAESGGEAVGVLRFDHAEDISTISLYLVPGRSGRGEGAQLIRAGLEWLRAERKSAEIVEAEVLPGNVASRRAFLAAGFDGHFETYRYALKRA